MVYLLENRRRATSFRLAPYRDRCAVLRFQPLEERRNVVDALLAFDLYVRDINDTFIMSEIVTSQPIRSLRHVNLVKEQHYRHDYLRFQPIARLVRILD